MIEFLLEDLLDVICSFRWFFVQNIQQIASQYTLTLGSIAEHIYSLVLQDPAGSCDWEWNSRLWVGLSGAIYERFYLDPIAFLTLVTLFSVVSFETNLAYPLSTVVCV